MTTETVRERGIAFSQPMVIAIRSDLKTQTRRVVKHRISPEWWEPKRPGVWTVYNTELSQDIEITCPYGVPGDILRVKEPYQLLGRWDEDPASKVPEDCRLPIRYPWTETVVGEMRDHWKFGRVRASRFMPKWACRERLEIVDIRVERLQSISEADAYAEGGGMRTCGCTTDGEKVCGMSNCEASRSDREWYAELWDKINGKTFPWSSNPFVFAISFKRLEKSDA